MSNLVIGALMPHPPILIPEIGKGELITINSTVEAMTQAAKVIVEEEAQTLILITPHGPAFQDAVGISVHPRLKGNFAAFGAPDVHLGFETDDLLMRGIIKEAERLGVNLVQVTEQVARQYRFNMGLDHGALVPLYYLHKAGFKGQLIHLSVGFLSYEEMYTFGKAVQLAVNKAGKTAAVVASGDLSHRLLPHSPAGYHPDGSEFDRQLIAAIAEMNIKALLAMPSQLIENAGECGLRPVYFLLGAMGGLSCSAEVLSYEGPFGVGYAVALVRIKQSREEV